MLLHFTTPNQENRRNIRTIPNPCRFSINGVTFGSTSVDVLLHMRNNEFTQRGVATEPLPLVHPEAGAPDLWTNMCKHLLVQRRYLFYDCYFQFPIKLIIIIVSIPYFRHQLSYRRTLISIYPILPV